MKNLAKNPKSEIRMTKENQSANDRNRASRLSRPSGFGLRHSFGISHWSFVIFVVLLTVVLALLEAGAAQLGSGFTYLARLTDTGKHANGTYDLQFTIYDSPEGGSQIGSVLTNEAVAVNDGLFTTTLDGRRPLPFSLWLPF
jgi:hypothetical protein